MLKVETMLLLQLNPDADVVVVVAGIAARPYCSGQLESSQKGRRWLVEGDGNKNLTTA